MEPVVVQELKNLIPPLTELEYEGLKRSIIAHGQLDLVQTGYIEEIGVFVLDGHNRARVLRDLGVEIEYEGLPIAFESVEDAEIWVIEHQLGRRNLNDWQKIKLLDEKRKRIESRQGMRTDLTSGPNGPEVKHPRDLAEEQLLLSSGTAHRGKYVLDHASEEIKERLDKDELTIGAAYMLAKREVRNKEYQSNVPQEFNGLYDIIYADPPWQYDFSVESSRDIENQYPTMSKEELIGLAEKIPAAENCVLFMWVTAPKFAEGLDLLELWGFKYKSNLAWDKEIMGMGYWFRGQHEHLLVGVKGEVSPPHESVRHPSVIRSKRSKHSKKPEEVYELIERYFPDKRKIELFARSQRQGWDSWGNQVP
jgi:N6-adenosine-specific RNA methylase IME4